MAEVFHAPLVERLGIRPGTRVAFVEPPAGYASTLGRLPEDVELLPEPQAPMDFIQAFTSSSQDLDRRLPELRDALGPAGMLWVSWPQQADTATDLDGGAVRSIGLRHGLVDVETLAVDETWGGLKFVRREQQR